MNLKIFMPSEGSQHRRLHTVWCHLHEILRKTKPEGQISGCLGPAIGEESWWKKADRDLLGGYEDVLFFHCGGYTTVHVCQNSPNCTLKNGCILFCTNSVSVKLFVKVNTERPSNHFSCSFEDELVSQTIFSTVTVCWMSTGNYLAECLKMLHMTSLRVKFKRVID